MPVETCSNCYGKGTVEYRYGKPGTDRHAKYVDVEWGEPSFRECKPCGGTGRRRARKVERTGTVYFTVDGKVDYERTVNEAHRKAASRWKGQE